MASKIEAFLIQMNGQATREAIANAMGENQKVINEVISEMAKLGEVTVSGNMVTL